MAVDKLVDSTQLDADLTSVANAIRTKGGTSADLAFPNGFVSAVGAIPTGQQLTFGLIAEINITEPVKTIRQSLPQIAIDYGVFCVDVDITLSQTDYFYIGIVPTGGTLNDSNGYMNMATSFDLNCYPMILDANKYGVVKPTVGIRTVNLSIERTRNYDAGTVFTELTIKMYNPNVNIVSGSIKIYGRLT